MIARDTYCLDSRKTGRYATGALLTGQRLYRCLLTTRGALPGGEDEQNWGEDLLALVGAPAGKATEAAIRAKVARAAASDETIESGTTTILTTVDPSGDVSHVVTIDATTADGPFTLVLAVSAVTVELVGLSQ